MELIDRLPLITNDEINAVVEVLRSRKLDGFRGSPGDAFYGGEKVREFESKFAQKFGVKYAVSFNSATSALHAACIGTEWGITTPYTMTSSAKCVLMAGGRVKFGDIDSDYFCLDPDNLSCADTIIAVHLCGQPCNMDKIMERARFYGARVIEDSAQAIGATYKGKLTGTIGDVGIFSFGAPKTLTTGTGGMLITNNEQIWDMACKVRNHGEMTGDLVIGYNYRMTEFQAAMGIVQLGKLDWQTSERQKLAGHLTQRLSKIEGITPPKVREDCTHVYYTYAVKTTLDRHKICTELGRKGIYWGEGYSVPLNRIPLYPARPMPIAEDMYDKTLMVTDIIRPPATIEDMDFIADSFEEIIRGIR